MAATKPTSENAAMVVFELTPPATAFECQHPYSGALLRIEGPFSTDDPRVIQELDQQAGVRRAS